MSCTANDVIVIVVVLYKFRLLYLVFCCSDRSQLANLITTLEELNGKLDEKSRSATPSTVISESNKSEGSHLDYRQCDQVICA